MLKWVEQDKSFITPVSDGDQTEISKWYMQRLMS